MSETRQIGWGTVLGGLGLVLVAVVLLLRSSPAPDVGRLEPVYAQPGEDVRVFTLEQGQTLGELLELALPAQEQNRVLMAFQEQASARRMRVGTEVAFRYRADDKWLRRVDVTLTADETVRLQRLDGGWMSSTVQTPVWVDTVYAAGSIESSLWMAVQESPALDALPTGDRARLIYRLDEIFQWQVDFSRQIQKGDGFRFAFERQVRPDGTMRTGHVISAELINAGKPFTAVWFDPNADGNGTYYDLEGQSLRRAFLKKPVAFRYITSRFSNSRLHPILKTWRAHRGVDYSAGAGSEIMATSNGVVTQRGVLGGLGNAVEIRHANGFRTRYGHMSSFASDVRVGTRVDQGQVIGYVGQTGLATAPHLHYELWQGQRAVDPLSIELPADDPVPTDEWGVWESESLTRWALLEELEGQMQYLGGERRIADIDRKIDEDVDGSDRDGPDDRDGDG